MTDMTPEEINRMIAEWAGICPHDSFEYLTPSDFYEGTPLCSQCGVAYGQLDKITDYFHTNAAMDLLVVLVERGYKPELSYHNLNWWHKFSLPGYKQPEYYAIKPTIPAAICTAILELIEMEAAE